MAIVFKFPPWVSCFRIMFSPVSLNERFSDLQLDQLNVQAILGIGGFGKVQLVTLVGDRSMSFALKVMTKSHIVETRQQQHILNEKTIMMEANNIFIVKLYKTFKGSVSVLSCVLLFCSFVLC